MSRSLGFLLRPPWRPECCLPLMQAAATLAPVRTQRQHILDGVLSFHQRIALKKNSPQIRIVHFHFCSLFSIITMNSKVRVKDLDSVKRALY